MTLPGWQHTLCNHFLWGLMLSFFWITLAFPLSAQEKDTGEKEAAAVEEKVLQESGSTPEIPAQVTNPEIGQDELTLRLIPLSREQLAVAADTWFKLYQEKTTELIEAQLAVNAAKDSTDPALAEDNRARLLDIGNQRESIGQRFNAVLDAWERKGGNADKIKVYRDYRAAVVVEQTRSADIKTIWEYIKTWLFSHEGGLQLLIKFGILIGGLFVLAALGRIVGYWARRAAHRSPRISRLLENFIEFATFWLFFAAGVLLLLSMIGINITPLFALIGGASFIIAFAMQNTLGNLAAGLMIMFSRPFDEGDFVDIGGVAGTVKSVSMMSTTVITPDNQVIIVPNSNVWGNVITNTTTATRRVDLTFGIGYQDNIETAQRVLEDTVRSHPLVLEKPEPVIRVAELAASSVNFIVRPWVMGTDYWTVHWDLTRQIKEAFDVNNISIPFPQQDIYVREGPSPYSATNAESPPAAGKRPAQ